MLKDLQAMHYQATTPGSSIIRIRTTLAPYKISQSLETWRNNYTSRSQLVEKQTTNTIASKQSTS
jgi:hypothetical protein